MLEPSTMVLTQILGNRADIAAPDIHVAFGVDSRYVPAVGACMRSIIVKNKDMRIQFHVISSSLSSLDIEQLSAFSEENTIALQLHNPGAERFSKLPTLMSPRFSSA